MRPQHDLGQSPSARSASTLPRNFCMLDVPESVLDASQTRWSLDWSQGDSGRHSRQSMGRRSPSVQRPPPPPTNQSNPRLSSSIGQEKAGESLEANTITNNEEYRDNDSGLSEEELKRASRQAKWKTDSVLIALMALVVMLQYLDKAIFSYAALLGLEQQNHLTGNEYSFAASIYYIGMIAGLPLWTFILQLFTTDLVLGLAVSLWGGITMCHAATHNDSDILAVRFFLGFLESCVTPALVLTTGTFYTPLETISRTAFWYSFNGVALILGGGLSYGLLNNPAIFHSSLAIWRQLYLILGGTTIFLGILILLFMPNHPSTTRLFTPTQRQAVMHRLETQSAQGATPKQRQNNNGTSTAAKSIPWYQWIESIRDPRLYIFFIGLLAGSIPNGGVTAYSTQLLAGFGFSISETLLVSIAPGGGQIVSVILFIAVALLFRSRIIGANLLLFIAIAGSSLMYVSSTGRTVKTVGYVLLNFGSPGVVALYSFIGSAVKGRGKRVIFTIVAQLAYAIGNIIGPLVFLDTEAPTYPTAKIVIIATLGAAALSLFAIGLLHAVWNHKRRHEQIQEDENETDFK